MGKISSNRKFGIEIHSEEVTIMRLGQQNVSELKSD